MRKVCEKVADFVTDTNHERPWHKSWKSVTWSVSRIFMIYVTTKSLSWTLSQSRHNVIWLYSAASWVKNVSTAGSCISDIHCKFLGEEIICVQNFILLLNFSKNVFSQPESLHFWTKIFWQIFWQFSTAQNLQRNRCSWPLPPCLCDSHWWWCFVDAKFVRWSASTHVALRHRQPLLPPSSLAQPPNICQYTSICSLSITCFVVCSSQWSLVPVIFTVWIQQWLKYFV